MAGRAESVHRAAAKPLASTRGVPALLSQSMARKLQPRAFGLSLQVLAAVHVALRCVDGKLTACTYHRCLRTMIARGTSARVRVAWPRASPDTWCIATTLGARARGSP